MRRIPFQQSKQGVVHIYRLILHQQRFTLRFFEAN